MRASILLVYSVILLALFGIGSIDSNKTASADVGSEVNKYVDHIEKLDSSEVKEYSN